MSFSSEHLSLDEIQKRLMKQVSSIVVLSDLALTEEDYKYLSTKVKMLFKFANDSNVVDDYKLAIVVYWVFSMVYWDKEHLGTLEMEASFDGLPPYKKKYYRDICMEAFDEYGIYRYHVGYKDALLRYRGIIARHAGIPREERGKVFYLLSQYQECNLVAEMVESIMMVLPDRTQTIFCCFDDHTKQKVIMNLRNLMISCQTERFSEEDLLEQHHYTSRELIRDMLKWCDENASITKAAT